MVAEYEASGLSREEFCRKQGLSLATLARYRKRQQQAQSEAGEASQWVAVELSGSGPAGGRGAASGLAVLLASGRRIEIGRAFDAGTLGRLLRLLESA